MTSIKKWSVPLIFLKLKPHTLTHTHTHTQFIQTAHDVVGWILHIPRFSFIRAQLKSTSLQHKDVLLADGRWGLRDRICVEAIEFD